MCSSDLYLGSRRCFTQNQPAGLLNRLDRRLKTELVTRPYRDADNPERGAGIGKPRYLGNITRLDVNPIRCARQPGDLSQNFDYTAVCA